MHRLERRLAARTLCRVAERLADGRTIDWNEAERPELAPADRRALGAMRFLESVSAIGKVGSGVEPPPPRPAQ